jgi:hypothetical protein
VRQTLTHAEGKTLWELHGSKERRVTNLGEEIAIRPGFRYDSRMRPGKSQGSHKHHGFWSLGQCGNEEKIACTDSAYPTRIWQKRWETRH